MSGFLPTPQPPFPASRRRPSRITWGKEKNRHALTGGVVFDPIEELRAGSLHQVPGAGSGPAGPDLVQGGVAVGTFGSKKRGKRKKRSEQRGGSRMDGDPKNLSRSVGPALLSLPTLQAILQSVEEAAVRIQLLDKVLKDDGLVHGPARQGGGGGRQRC